MLSGGGVGNLFFAEPVPELAYSYPGMVGGRGIFKYIKSFKVLKKALTLSNPLAKKISLKINFHPQHSIIYF